MNFKIKFKKYGLRGVLFILAIYVSSFFGKIFDPINEFLLNWSVPLIKKIYNLITQLFALKVPVYSLLFGFIVVWFVYKIFMFLKFRKNKLQIIKATYGKDNKIIDITDQLNSLVEKDKLKTVLSNAIAGDPFVGVVKSGYVKFRFNGNTTEKQYYEGEIIELP